MATEKFDVLKHKARGLTRSERKAFQKSGFHPQHLKNKNDLQLDDMVDYILDTFYPGINFDDADNADLVELATSTINLTYGKEAKATKNS